MEEIGIEDKKNVLSEFNEAKFKIWRVHSSWTLCNQYRRGGNLVSWKWELDTIWDEFADTAEKKDKRFVERIKNCDDAIEKSEKAKDRRNIYSNLREKHRLLKEIQDAVGMGAKFRSEEEDDIEV